MAQLVIVATPIGNLKDITFRALEELKKADVILCEDTRVSQKLLSHYQIKKPVLSYHEHSKIQKIKKIIDLLKEDKNLALISDSGTPGIADPGNKLISMLLKECPDLKISAVPGPSALATAASLCGFPMDRFLFLGFLPKKKKRKELIKKIIFSEYPVIIYESSYRLVKTLREINENWDGEIVIARELTKKFETIYRGKIWEVLKKIQSQPLKGEFTIVLNTPAKNIEIEA
jgi:16S rRNA (cytidine1402-2'-O)-methyltransferase